MLAIQGDFKAHKSMLELLGAQALEVRRPWQLPGLDGLIIPGGESTTIVMGIERSGLGGPLKDFSSGGRPVFGTCAGLILLGSSHLGLMDIDVERNAYGRQIKSFEAPVTVRGLGDEPFEAVFIRAPRIERRGTGVEVLAELEGAPVVARQGSLLVCSFHPELTDDLRLHALFCGLVDGHRRDTHDNAEVSR